MESEYGSLYHLDVIEKAKVYRAFNVIFRALPLYQDQSELERRSFNPELPKFDPQVKYVTKQYNNYNCYDSLMFDWLLLNSITHNCHCRHGGMGGWPGNHHRPGGNHHGHADNASDKTAEFIAVLILLFLAAIAAVLTFIALYYMLSEFLNSAERFYYNEGWLKAALRMANSIAFGAGSTLLTLTFAAAPLASLAMTAGLNPASVVVIGAVLLTIIGASFQRTRESASSFLKLMKHLVMCSLY